MFRLSPLIPSAFTRVIFDMHEKKIEIRNKMETNSTAWIVDESLPLRMVRGSRVLTLLDYTPDMLKEMSLFPEKNEAIYNIYEDGNYLGRVTFVVERLRDGDIRLRERETSIDQHHVERAVRKKIAQRFF